MIFHGEVELDGAVILKNVTFHINHTPSSEVVMGHWSGSFRIPSDGLAGAAALYAASSAATLKLEDGRSGQFHWTESSDMRPGATIEFKGTGPLN